MTTAKKNITAWLTKEDEKIISGMIGQMNKTTARANAGINKALAFIEASNKRIEAMDRKSIRPVGF